MFVGNKSHAYQKSKLDLNAINSELHILFLKSSQYLPSILKKYLPDISWLSFPSALKINIINARFIEKDGDQKKIVFDDGKNFYLLDWYI